MCCDVFFLLCDHSLLFCDGPVPNLSASVLLDAQRALFLLEDYQTKLHRTEDQQLRHSIQRVINIFQSNLFQALIGKIPDQQHNLSYWPVLGSSVFWFGYCHVQSSVHFDSKFRFSLLNNTVITIGHFFVIWNLRFIWLNDRFIWLNVIRLFGFSLCWHLCVLDLMHSRRFLLTTSYCTAPFEIFCFAGRDQPILALWLVLIGSLLHSPLCHVLVSFWFIYQSAPYIWS